ncbi:hypothetical protein H0H93_009424, partial [Arthromyces matolae]
MIAPVAIILLLPLLYSFASPLQHVLTTVSHDNVDNDWELQGWLDPRLNGGRFLDFTTPKLGEPLNVIISARSDPFILTDTGIREYAKSIGFADECLGLHIGDLHSADLGDGDGRKFEQFLARQHYFPIWGTCWESLAGRDFLVSRATSGSRWKGKWWKAEVDLRDDLLEPGNK